MEHVQLGLVLSMSVEKKRCFEEEDALHGPFKGHEKFQCLSYRAILSVHHRDIHRDCWLVSRTTRKFRLVERDDLNRYRPTINRFIGDVGF